MTIKELFDKAENGTLTYEQFEEARQAAKAKFVDLSEGGYVSHNKYSDDLAAKDKEIETLNSTISTRDTDLAGLQKQLEEAGVDASKLEELTGNLKDLQAKYDGDMKAYKEQLKNQAYEFAVKEFANSKKFTSNAAKRDFTQAMIAKQLKMDKDKILGAEDFVSSYSADNEDAFVAQNDETETPAVETESVPKFVSPTSGGPQAPATDANAFHFNFTGVRPVTAQ